MATDDTREKLLAAAGPVFAERGFQSATVREICQAAGVNLASVNYYFGDKEQLDVEAVRRARMQRMQQVPLPQRPAGASAETRLSDFIHTLLSRMLGDDEAPWQTRLLMREVLQPTRACREMVQEHFRPQFELLVTILREVVPAGAPDWRLHQIAFSMIGQCLYYRVAKEIVGMLIPEQERREHYSIERLADHITQFSLAALGVRPSARSHLAKSPSAITKI